MMLRIGGMGAVLALALAVAGWAAQGEPIDRVGWLAGCWEMRAGGLLIEEQWMAPRAGVMLGMSRTTRDGRFSSHESIRIQQKQGGLSYYAAPSGQEPTVFDATAVERDRVTFENPEHDFPVSVHYRRAGADSVYASIAGPRGGDVVTIEFPMARSECGATASR